MGLVTCSRGGTQREAEEKEEELRALERMVSVRTCLQVNPISHATKGSLKV